MKSQVKRFIAWHLGTEHMELGASPQVDGYTGRGCEKGHRASMPSLGTTLPAPLCDHQPTSSPDLILWGFGMEASSRRRDGVQHPSPSVFSWGGGRAENSKLLIKACSFLWPPLIRKPSRSQLEQKKLLLPRKLQRFQDLCVRNQGKRLNIGTKDVSSAIIT